MLGFGLGVHTKDDIEEVRQMFPDKAASMPLLLISAIIVWKPPQKDD